MLSTPSLESYDKLKTEFNTYRTQAEDNQRELNKTIKHLKEAIELLKKENTRLKADSKDIKKLKEEKLSLSKQIMELESEAMLYKNFNGGDNLIFPSFTTTKFNFSIIENSSKQKIKDSLKNKNEEILILKNELMKKDQIISNLQKKEKESVYSQNDSNYKNHIVLNQYLFRTKSESDFFHMSQNKYNKKYFGTVVSTSHSTQRGGRLSQLLNSSNKKNNDNIITVNTNGFLKRKSGDIYSELNVTMTNEGDDDGHNALEKNIYSELKNILDEKRNFILQTMTYENFSFDIISTKKTSNTMISNMNNSLNSAVSTSTNGKNHKYSNSSTTNINPSIAFTLTKDIDALLQIIRQRKKIVLNDKKSLEEIKESNYK